MDLMKMAIMPHQWSVFSSDLVMLRDLQALIPDFSLRFATRESNAKTDLLARCARGRKHSFQYIGSSLPNWVPNTSNVSEP
ncbi:unnamed protein product [Cochlearia groenlandica]